LCEVNEENTVRALKVLSISLVSLVLIAGCAGRDFVLPDSSELRIGQSTYAQVIGKMGEPRAAGEILKNGEKVKAITYGYATTGGEPLESGVIPSRALAYFFHQDRLVGQEFLSSFKSDNTNFDDSKVSGLEKGKTTRAEVVQALGRPTAAYVKPLVKETTGEAIGYAYATTSGGALSGLKFFQKRLVITFDAADRVLDVDYSTSGSK